MDLVNRTAHDAIASRTINLTEQIRNVTQLDDSWVSERVLNQMIRLLQDICSKFQQQQRAPPKPMITRARVDGYLAKIEDQIKWARFFIRPTQRPQQCIEPKLSEQLFDWKWRWTTHVRGKWMTRMNNLFQEGYELFLTNPKTGDELLMTNPTTGLVEELVIEAGIKHGEVLVERWLREAPHVRIIGVCGGAGFGKTRLLQKLYSTYKVSDFFDVVIWVTVGQLGILEVQDCIVRTVKLDLGIHHSNNEMGRSDMRIKLLEYLKTKKFLLIFDDLWSPLDLNKLGVEFGNGKGSKFICSSRMRNVIEETGANNSIYIQPLTRDESWELFRNVAFKDDNPPQDLEHIARKFADGCKGVPLAIHVIAATMKANTSVNEWNLALTQMQTPIEHIFPAAHLYRSIDAHLYQILRWSYERLPDANFKSCFLYCAMFPREEDIEVEKMVGMWVSEGLVQSINTAHSYIKLLVDRCFFQVTHIPHGRIFLKTNNTLRDLAIYIGWREEHCLFVAGQRFQSFPIDMAMNVWKRISYYSNNIKCLPAKRLQLKCTKLVTLILGGNKELKEVPNSFLSNFLSIRVLDLSRTKIKVLPTTLWQLTQLEYLDVSYTEIEDVSEDIGHLSNLQFLNLSGCSELKSLPQAIGHLSQLQFLNMLGCSKLTSIPSVIYELENLKHFQCNIFVII